MTEVRTRGQGRMTGRPLDRLREMNDEVSGILRSLDNKPYDLPELEPARSEAISHAAKLQAWLSEMEYIADTELYRRGR